MRRGGLCDPQVVGETQDRPGLQRAQWHATQCGQSWLLGIWHLARGSTPAHSSACCRKYRFPTVANTLFMPNDTSVHPGSEPCFQAQNTVSSHPRTVPSAWNGLPIVIHTIQSSSCFLELAQCFRRSAQRLSTSGCFRTRIHHSSTSSTSHSVRNHFSHHDTLALVIISLYPL